MSIGKNIKIIRKRWGMSQQAFGALLDKTQYDISNYEKEKNDPRLDFAVRLEELTGIPVYQLYKGEVIAEYLPHQPLKEKPVLKKGLYPYAVTTEDKSLVVREQNQAYKKAEKEQEHKGLLALIASLQATIEQMNQRLAKLEEEVKTQKKGDV